jgi:hypothetical protein
MERVGLNVANWRSKAAVGLIRGVTGLAILVVLSFFPGHVFFRCFPLLYMRVHVFPHPLSCSVLSSFFFPFSDLLMPRSASLAG